MGYATVHAIQLTYLRNEQTIGVILLQKQKSFVNGLKFSQNGARMVVPATGHDLMGTEPAKSADLSPDFV
jgi:hypothetical protein